MTTSIVTLINKRLLILTALISVFCMLTVLPLPWNESLNNFFIDLQFKLRGSRQVAKDLVVVYIGDEELKSLKSWPITRDYYSYALHILKANGAKVIAFDILFAQRDKYHPEFDRTLINFVGTCGNVCLPMAFSEITPTGRLYEGKQPIYPIKELMVNAAGIGFSNFVKSKNVSSVPLVVSFQDTIFTSFGLEMATLFLGNKKKIVFEQSSISINDTISIPLNKKGCLRLNHFGSIKKINAIGFIDFLQSFKDKPNVPEFKNKLVLITVSATGIANFKSTPFNTVFPSSLVHLTVAENIIHQNYLTEIPFYLKIFIFVVLVAGMWWLENLYKVHLIFHALIFLVFYMMIVMLLFTYSNLILPIFYPAIAIFSTMIAIQLQNQQEKQKMDTFLKEMLQEQLSRKENELQLIKEKLQELNLHFQQQSRSKEEILSQAEENQQKILKLEKEINDLKAYSSETNIIEKERFEFEEIIYARKGKMEQVLDLVSKVVTNDISVLIIGETGTGKELIARAIHKKSDRKNAPFVAVNCGALTESLLESELFGHEKGSFTGAITMRKGKFELADGGVIFLDEISETSPSFQSRLLRVLQESTLERVGGEKSIKIDIRVIAATNKNLQIEIDQSRFRSDLFYRLNGFQIYIPPLRERNEDLPLLVAHFLKKHKFEISISENSMHILQNYVWPGNVRELENVVRRAAIMASSANRGLIKEEDLPVEIQTVQSSQFIGTIHKPMEEQILESLRLLKFSRSAISQTAKTLGNKDRGTITEYFRGICFHELVINEFDIPKTAQIIAGTTEREVVAKVELKINEYLNNLKFTIRTLNDVDVESLAKGLPRKYHAYLNSVLDYLYRIQ